MALSAAMSSEAQRIETLRVIFAGSGSGSGSGGDAAAGVSLGIGDDAAVLEPPPGAGRIVISVDEQVEGTHFRRELLSPEDIGYRATVAACSDLAAMGAKPWCAVAALSLPDWVSDDLLEAIARGQRDASRTLGLAIVGGNLTRGPVLSIATTVLGFSNAPRGPLLRSGAAEGDGVWIAGQLGLASLGLRALVEQRTERALEHARSVWRRPSACIAEAASIAHRAHAAIDVSDGLAKDLGAICNASHVDAALDEAALVAFAVACGAASAATMLGADVLAAMLGGGEDYALVIALDPSASEVEGFVRIGTFVARDGDAARVWLIGSDGGRRSVSGGFDHWHLPDDSL